MASVVTSDAAVPSDFAVPNDLAQPVDLLPQRVPVFVAQGHVGRTLISCDDGKTWTHDINDDSSIVCYNPDECDHQPNSGAGITYDNGWFFASFGHGSTMGTLRRSHDGYTWEKVQTGNSEGGISFFDGIVMWMDGHYSISMDQGMTFTANDPGGGYLIPRTIAQAGSILLASGDDPVAKVSQDAGKTWTDATLNGVAWGRNVFVARGSDNSLVTVSSVHAANNVNTAYTARSTDNGLTWTGSTLYSGTDYADWCAMFFDGTRFVGWFDNQMWTSTDGVTWSSTPVVTNPPVGLMTTGPIARGPTGTLVTVPNVWANYYDKQHAFRSTDGLNWEMLDAAHFTGGHPILHITTGYVDSTACP
jgi:hypothetical protein